MSDYNFMPTLEIFRWGEIDPTSSFDAADLMAYEDKTRYGTDSPFPILMEKLFEYVVPVISFRSRINGESKFITEPMRRCTVSDFESRGYVFKSDIDKE